MGELRQRIVARAHDHDAIATAGQPDQGVATGAAVWKCKSLSATPFDFTNNVAASDAAVDRAAEIDGLGHGEDVLIVQPVYKAVHQRVSHETNRTVAMRLKH